MLSRLRSRRPSHATVTAYVALFIALGGTSYAAVKLPKNSVGSAQIKSNAVSSTKVKNGSLTSADFTSGALPQGARGAQGPKGDRGDAGQNGADGAAGAPGTPGADGTAAAFARVQADGLLAAPSTTDGPVMSKGITEAMIQHTTGQYCFDLDFVPRSAVVTIDNRDQATTSTQIASVTTTRGTPLTLCPAPFTDVRVNIEQPSDSNSDGNFNTFTPVDQDFYIWFEK
jgi:hypothetical protein